MKQNHIKSINNMKKITIGTSSIQKEDIDAVVSVMENGYISSGKETKEFEEKFAQYHGFHYGTFVNSGQSALECALELAKSRKKKNRLKVIIPTTTYAATLWAILRTNNDPIFCDIGEDYNLDCSFILDRWEQFKDADIIIPVNLCGKGCYIEDGLLDRFFVIRDACESTGYKDKQLYGISCYSFYVSHLITTGCGGMICTHLKHDKNFFDSFIAHGRIFGGDFTKFQDEWIDRFLFDKIGVSYRSNNILAAIGLSQLNKLSDIIKKRKENAGYLIEKYSESNFLKEFFIFPDYKYWEECVFQFFPILIKEKIDREDFLKYLFKNNIDSRVLLSLTNQPIFIKNFGYIENNYPFSAKCNKNGFIIGCHQDLNIKEMQHVIDCFTKYCGEL